VLRASHRRPPGNSRYRSSHLLLARSLARSPRGWRGHAVEPPLADAYKQRERIIQPLLGTKVADGTRQSAGEFFPGVRRRRWIWEPTPRGRLCAEVGPAGIPRSASGQKYFSPARVPPTSSCLPLYTRRQSQIANMSESVCRRRLKATVQNVLRTTVATTSTGRRFPGWRHGGAFAGNPSRLRSGAPLKWRLPCHPVERVAERACFGVAQGDGNATDVYVGAG
jgi:hypothetical protein